MFDKKNKSFLEIVVDHCDPMTYFLGGLKENCGGHGDPLKTFVKFVLDHCDL
jgi:hypothetical protein